MQDLTKEIVPTNAGAEPAVVEEKSKYPPPNPPVPLVVEETITDQQRIHAMQNMMDTAAGMVMANLNPRFPEQISALTSLLSANAKISQGNIKLRREQQDQGRVEGAEALVNTIFKHAARSIEAGEVPFRTREAIPLPNESRDLSTALGGDIEDVEMVANELYQGVENLRDEDLLVNDTPVGKPAERKSTVPVFKK